MHNCEAVDNALARRLNPLELAACTLNTDRARVVLDVLAIEARLQQEFAFFRCFPPWGGDVIRNW
jgi:hypothetical protein